MKQNENVKAMGVVQILSKKWAETDESIKQKLTAEYMKEKEEYTKKIAQYEMKLTEEQKATIRGARQELEESREKRALRKVSRSTKSCNVTTNLFWEFCFHFRKTARTTSQKSQLRASCAF